MQRTLFFFFALMVALGGLPVGASAQGPQQARDPSAEDTERARALFHEGVELINARNYAEASVRFREALALRHAPAIAYNLAAALVETGELVEAGELLRDVLADDTTPDSVRVHADQLQASLEERYARLTVYVVGDRGDATIHVGDRQIDETQLGMAISLNPGTHTVTARRGDAVLETEERTIQEGQTADVSLDPSSWSLLDPELAGGGEEDGTGRTPIYAKWWFWVAIGVIVGGAIAIGVAAGSGGTEDPVQGNATPPIITF